MSLDFKDPRDFVRELDREELPFYKSCEVLITDFFGSKLSKDELVRAIKQRCFNEFKAAETFADELVRFGYDLDRGLYTLIARQVEDEAMHFDLLAKVIERFSGQTLHSAELKPTKAQEILGYAGDDIVGHMAFRFCAEGRSAFVAGLMVRVSEKIGFQDMAAAYKIIERDEIFHKKVGDIGLEMYARTEESQTKIREAVKIARERAFRNFYEIYGPNEPALKTYEEAYGPLPERY